MAVTLRGVSGELRYVYQLAGTVTEWTITQESGVWSLAGTIDTLDTFRASQRPLTFVIPHARGQWLWPITSLQISGASLSAVLGPRSF